MTFPSLKSYDCTLLKFKAIALPMSIFHYSHSYLFLTTLAQRGIPTVMSLLVVFHFPYLTMHRNLLFSSHLTVLQGFKILH